MIEDGVLTSLEEDKDKVSQLLIVDCLNYLTTTDHTRHLKDEAGTVLLISRL